MTIQDFPQQLPRTFPPAFSLHRGRDRRSARIAMPYLSRAADRPRSPMACNPATSAPTAAWCGRAPTGPSQMMVEVATTESFNNARALPPIAALPESDFTAKMLLENLPAGQDIFYRVRFRDLSHTDDRERAGGRPLPHRAGRPARRQLRLGRRRRRPGLGHQSRRRRHVHLRHHAQAPAGFPAAFRRHHLCRRRRSSPR